MAYSNKFRREVLQALSSGMTMAEVSMKYNISMNTVSNWKRDPEKYVNRVSTGGSRYSLEQKVAILGLIESRQSSVRQIARAHGISQNTINDWVKDKNHILAVYSTQREILAAQATGNLLTEEMQDMSGKRNNADGNNETKALQQENRYLKARIAYLEKLMELNGTPAPEVKKKSDTEPSGPSPQKADGQ